MAVVENGAALLYRLYDVADEIDLEGGERLLRQWETSRLRLTKAGTRAVVIPHPPVTARLRDYPLKLPRGAVMGKLTLRLYDFGVISLMLRVPVPKGTPLRELGAFARTLEEMEEPERIFRETLEEILTTLRPALFIPHPPSVAEDFVVYFLQELDPHLDAEALLEELDLAELLLREKGPFHPAITQELLRHRFSYAPDDLAVLNWDSALVYEPSGSLDIPDLLEFASAQLLELEYYDQLLGQELEGLYGVLEESRRRRFFFPTYNRYAALMTRLSSLVLEITEVIERVRNALTVTEDIFYARIYTRANQIFRTADLIASVERKTSIVRSIYGFLNDEVNNLRSMILEATIVILIILEVLLALLGKW